jgi:hypothetical protein
MKMQINKGNFKTRIKIKFEPYWYPYFVFVGCKYHKQFLINLLCFSFDIFQVCNDWMVKTDDVIVLDDGRRFETWERNPKYENEKISAFAFPNWI